MVGPPSGCEGSFCQLLPDARIAMSMKDLRDQNLGYAEEGCELLTSMGVPHSDDPYHVVIGQLVAPVHASFISGIHKVFFVGAKTQMIGVYAKGIVPGGAVVQHLESVRDSATVNNPANPVSVNVLGRVRPLANLAVLIGAISVGRPDPKPASFGMFYDFGPESFDNGSGDALCKEDGDVRSKLFSIHRMLDRALGCFRNAGVFCSHQLSSLFSLVQFAINPNSYGNLKCSS